MTTRWEYDAGPLSKTEKRDLAKAYCDWTSNDAYWDGRNYRLKSAPRRGIASWNKIVKRVYGKDTEAFATSARARCPLEKRRGDERQRSLFGRARRA